MKHPLRNPIRGHRWAAPVTWLTPGVIVTVMLGLGVILRLYRFGAPLLDQHSFRQTQTASQVWLWDRFGFSFFEYRVPMFGGGHWVLEFPWYQSAVYALTSVFGFHEELGRVVSLLAFVASGLLIYEIAKRLFGSRAAGVASVGFFTFMPMTLFWYRTFLIDPMLIAVALVLLLASIRIYQSFTWGWVLAFIAAFFVVTLGKANLIVVFALPVAVLVVKGVVVKRIPWRGALVMSVGVVGSGVALWMWTRHADALNFPSNGQTFSNMRWWYFGSTVFDANLWKTVFARFLDQLNPVGMLFVGLGLIGVAGLRSGFRLVIIALVVSNVVSIAIFANLNRIHDYYQLPYYSTLALLGGLGLWTLARIGLALGRASAIEIAGGFLAGLAITWCIAVYSTGYFSDSALNLQAQVQGSELAQTTPDQRILYLGDGIDPNEPTVLYEARRRGWRLHTTDRGGIKGRLEQAPDIAAVAIQKGDVPAPNWLPPLLTQNGFRQTADGDNFLVFTR